MHRLPMKCSWSPSSTAFCFSPSRKRIQIQVNTTKSDNVNYSKGWNSKLSFPQNIQLGLLTTENLRQYIKMITLNSMQKKSQDP